MRFIKEAGLWRSILSLPGDPRLRDPRARPMGNDSKSLQWQPMAKIGQPSTIMYDMADGLVIRAMVASKVEPSLTLIGSGIWRETTP